MNLKWKAQKGIWNPVSNDLPLEDSGDQDDPKWLGSPEGGRRVSELVGVPKGKIKSPERGQWSDGAAPSHVGKNLLLVFQTLSAYHIPPTNLTILTGER